MQQTTWCSFRGALERADRDRAGIDAKLRGGGVGVLEQTRLEVRIDPGACHHPGAERGAAGIEVLDRAAQLACAQHALLDQQLADRLGHHLVVLERSVLDVGLMRVAMAAVMLVIVVRGHGSSASSQCS